MILQDYLGLSAVLISFVGCVKSEDTLLRSLNKRESLFGSWYFSDSARYRVRRQLKPVGGLENINRNTGFSSATSESQASHINTKNPNLSLGQALAVNIDISGPLGSVSSGFQGNINTGKGATSGAAQLGGVGGKGGPATSLTQTFANIETDGSTDGIASTGNKANVMTSGNALGQSDAAGSVGAKQKNEPESPKNEATTSETTEVETTSKKSIKKASTTISAPTSTEATTLENVVSVTPETTIQTTVGTTLSSTTAATVKTTVVVTSTKMPKKAQTTTPAEEEPTTEPSSATTEKTTTVTAVTKKLAKETATVPISTPASLPQTTTLSPEQKCAQLTTIKRRKNCRDALEKPPSSSFSSGFATFPSFQSNFNPFAGFQTPAPQQRIGVLGSATSFSSFSPMNPFDKFSFPGR